MARAADAAAVRYPAQSTAPSGRGSSPLLRNTARASLPAPAATCRCSPPTPEFDSGSWPGFFQPLDNALGRTEDRTLGMTRIEVHCRHCGGHLGHVFDDGPSPRACALHRRFWPRVQTVAGVSVLIQILFGGGNCCPARQLGLVPGPGPFLKYLK